jgi:HlyD family secretion protein
MARILLLLLLSSLTLSGCGRAVSATASSTDELVVRSGAFEQRLLLTGELEASAGHVITMPRLPVWETTLRWVADDGIQVRQGERLAELDNSAFTRDLERTRTELQTALDQLAQHQARRDADVAEKMLEVERKTTEHEKASIAAAIPAELLPLRELEERRLKLERTHRELAKAVELLESSKKALEADERNILLTRNRAAAELSRLEISARQTELLAPTDGLFLVADQPMEGRKLQEGDRIWFGMPIARIPDISTIEVAAHLWDVDDGAIASGQSVQLTLDAIPDRQFSGRILSIAPVAQEVSRLSSRRAFRVTIGIDGIDATVMRPGLSVKAAVLQQRIDDVLLVPRTTLGRSNEKPVVTLRSGATVPVELIGCNAQECAVRSSDLIEGARLRSAAAGGSGDRV